MNSTERLNFIKQYLTEQKVVTTSSIKNLLNVSEVTIRKDLEHLEKEGTLKRVRGGAALIEQQPPLQPSLRIENYDSKKIISELALSLINKGDSIFLGAGSTCYVLGTMLPSQKSISVITNNVSASVDMTENTANNVLVGGEISIVNGMHYTSSIDSFNSYGGLSVNRAFLGIDGIDLSAGFTTNYLYSVMIHQYIPKIARQFIVLADHTKLNKICLVQGFGAHLPEYVVCDRYVPEYGEFFKSKNIKYLHP